VDAAFMSFQRRGWDIHAVFAEPEGDVPEAFGG